MSRAFIIQPSENLGPGRIVPMFRDFGIPIEIIKLWQGQLPPTELDEVRVLVVLGDLTKKIADVEHDKNLVATVDLLKLAIAKDRATLGLGFGAQLLAHAAGAKIYPNAKPGATPDAPATPMPEYGFGPVAFPFPGGTEPIVFGMTDGAPMFHWHTDTFDLPKLPAPANPAPPPAPPPPTGNALLSSNKTCKNQAFRFKSRLFGFQYHFELTREDFEKIIANESNAITTAMGTEGGKKIRTELEKNYSRYARLGERLVNNLVQYLHAY